MREPCVNGDPVLHVFARIIGGGGQVPCSRVLPEQTLATPRRRENRRHAGIDQACFRLMIPTRRDIQIVICVPSDPAPRSLWPTFPPLRATPPPPSSSFLSPTTTLLLGIGQPSYFPGGVKSCIVPATLDLSVVAWWGAAVRGWPLFGPQPTPTLACECCPTNQAPCEAPRRLNLRRVFAAKVIKHRRSKSTEDEIVRCWWPHERLAATGSSVRRLPRGDFIRRPCVVQ